MSKPKILIVYDVRGWAYHRRAEALKANQPDDLDIEICPFADWEARFRIGRHDVLFLIDYQCCKGVHKVLKKMDRHQHIPRPAYIVSHNKDSNSRLSFWELSKRYADLVICNNEDIYNHGGRQHGTVCIANGVDQGLFRVNVPIQNRPRRVLWTGSTGKSKQKRYHEILLPLRERLEAGGVQVDYRPVDHLPDPKVMTSKQMVDWYNGGSVVLCASGSEGTPNITLEGMACGCVSVSTRVANIVEFGSHRENCVLCEPTVDDFEAGVFYALENRERLSYSGLQAISMGGWDWSHRAQYFYQLFRRVARDGADSITPFSYRDIHWKDI